jgi:hypothetical protein
MAARCVVVGKPDRCLHAADLWRATHGPAETFTPDQTAEAVTASAPRLFGDGTGIIALDAHTWSSNTIDAIAQTAQTYLLCVSPTKKLTAAQRRTWQLRGDVIELDDTWHDKAVADLFSEQNITLDRSARQALARSGADIGRVRSLVFAATHAGISVLDERKTLILLGDPEHSPGLFRIVDTCIDNLTAPTVADLDGIEPVVLAQQLAEALRGALCVAQAGVSGTAAATLIGAPAFTAKTLTKRARMNRTQLEAGFEAACHADHQARTTPISARDVALFVIAALTDTRTM